jgi:hypothetical protein
MPPDIHQFPAVICHYQLSTAKVVLTFTERNGKIMDACPLAKQFIGQPMQNLISWAQTKLGPTTLNLLKMEPDTAKDRNPYL